MVGDENSIDPVTSSPELKGRKDPAGWRLDFNLKDFFEGVNIYRQMEGEAGFTKKAFDNSNPYLDTDTVKPGTRYFAVYVLNDKEVGVKSNEVVI